MSNRLAVIDLGTNTFNLLIADIYQDKFIHLFSEEIPVKLGEGGINKGLITTEAWIRGITAMNYIHQKMIEYNCNKVKAVATSAIRSASNGNDFSRAVKAETGIIIEIINGSHEAELIYGGVRAGLKLESTTLIMDIGGGSIEFIICDKDYIYWNKSYKIGATRIQEKYHNSDPITSENIQLIELHLKKSLTVLFHQCKIYNPQNLVGSAGAFETFAELVSLKNNQLYNKSDKEFIFNIDQFTEIANELLKSNHSQRAKMPGLIPFRTDIIVSATVIIQYILRRTGINSLKLSTYSLKEGVLFRMLDE